MKNKNSRNQQFRPTIREEALARHVANRLNDTKNLPFYISCCRRYPESCIKKALAKTIEIALKKIKARRSEFFKQLIYEYAREAYNNSRD